MHIFLYIRGSTKGIYMHLKMRKDSQIQNSFIPFHLSHFIYPISFGGANTIIWGAHRRFTEPLNSAHLPRAHANRHGNRVVP
jgi:hypothetical protein